MPQEKVGTIVVGEASSLLLLCLSLWLFGCNKDGCEDAEGAASWAVAATA